MLHILSPPQYYIHFFFYDILFIFQWFLEWSAKIMAVAKPHAHVHVFLLGVCYSNEIIDI